MTSAVNAADANDVFVSNVSYDALSRRKSLVYGNGTRALYDLSPRGDLECHAWNLTGGAPSACNVTGPELKYLFTYNNVGQTLTEALATSPASLKDSLVWKPAHDVNDAYQANELNQYTSTDGFTPDYDDNGNMISDGRGRTMLYNAENQLYMVTGGDQDVSFAWYGDPLAKANNLK